MPGDLRDPEQSTQWHYDPKYDNPQTTNTADGSVNMDDYIQSIAEEILNKRVDQGIVDRIILDLEGTGYMHRNPGEEGFRNRVKALLMAGKVASAWLI